MSRLLAIAMLCASMSAWAAEHQWKYDGAELGSFAALYEKSRADGDALTRDEVQRVLYFHGYVLGVAHTSRAIMTWCLPQGGATAAQLWSVAAKYLRAHPDKWHEPPSHLVMRSLSEAFPCKGGAR